MIDTSERTSKNIITDPKNTNNDTIIIDNGTFELKAGFSNDLCIVSRNRLYKSKERVSLVPFPSSSAKTMFDGDVVVGFDVLELTIDQILSHLKPKALNNLIITSTPHSPTEEEMIKLLFDVYNFNKIQVGYDFIYCYHKYFDKKDCVIVDLKYSSIIVCVVKDNAIKDIYKMSFGGRELMEYINYNMTIKYRETRKDYKGLISYIRVSDDYEKEAISIYHEMCNGIYDHCVFLSEPVVAKPAEPQIKKVKKSVQPAMMIPQIDYQMLDTPDSNLTKDELKEKRRQKMVFCSTFSRIKTKIEKLFQEFNDSISLLEDELEKQSNLSKYISRKKERFNTLKRELELREQLRRECKNKKSREFIVKHKEGILTPEEQEIKNKIADAEDEEQDKKIIEALDKLAAEIVELDPEFIPFFANTVEILRGDTIGRQCVNVELIKWPEIFFNPSIIGSEHMGLSEIFENVYADNQIENVLVCGGFSFIPNVENRIRSEIQCLLRDKSVNLIKAVNPTEDPFYGCRFSELFPVYTSDQYRNN